MEIDRYLEDIENRIDPAVEDDLREQWRSFCLGKCRDEVFIPRRSKATPTRVEWPQIWTNDALDDIDLMVLSQFAGCSRALGMNIGRTLGVRSNYGVPILAAPFGCELFVMAKEADSLPNCHQIGPERTRAWLKNGMPSVDHPYLQPVWETGRRLAEVGKKYPKIGKYVAIYHPDFQGPMDILELIWGSEIFVAFIDEPGTIHQLLQLITDFYKACMQRWLSIVPRFDDRFSYHWLVAHPGQIMLRDDSAMNLPPEMFVEFIAPYDQQLLETFGGGCIHACGRLDHWTHFVKGIKGAFALHMSQPRLNNVEKVLHDTVDQGILLLDLSSSVARELQANKRPLCGRVQTFE